MKDFFSFYADSLFEPENTKRNFFLDKTSEETVERGCGAVGAAGTLGAKVVNWMQVSKKISSLPIYFSKIF